MGPITNEPTTSERTKTDGQLRRSATTLPREGEFTGGVKLHPCVVRSMPSHLLSQKPNSSQTYHTLPCQPVQGPNHMFQARGEGEGGCPLKKKPRDEFRGVPGPGNNRRRPRRPHVFRCPGTGRTTGFAFADLLTLSLLGPSSSPQKRSCFVATTARGLYSHAFASHRIADMPKAAGGDGRKVVRCNCVK